MQKFGRNDPCHCGSGIKYKKCCMHKPIVESEDLAKQDWRLRAASSLAKPFISPWTGVTHPVGTAVTQSSSMSVDGTRFNFGVPSATALFLDLSKKAFKEAKIIRTQTSFFNRSSGKMPFIESNTLFDCLEQMMASVVFAYTSVESFANSAIPESHIHKEARKDGRCIEEYTKDQIERSLSLDKKLEILIQLPALNGVTNPKGTVLWERFQNLEALRDRIIHLKSADIKASKPDDPIPDTIWQELLKMPDTFQITVEVIRHYSGTHPPRWLLKFISD